MTPVQPPFVLQNASHGAELFRQALNSLIGFGGGVERPGALLVSPHEAPNMSVNVLGGTPQQGGIWIPGTSVPSIQGMYYCYNDASFNIVIGPADPANPRIDRVVAVVKDEAVAGAGNEWTLEALAGTPEAGATLENLKGIHAAPASSLDLAYVLVPAKAVSITAEDIKNVATQMEIGGGLVGDGSIVAGRTLVATGNAFSAAVERTPGIEYEPSETREVEIGLTIFNGVGGSIVAGLQVGSSPVAIAGWTVAPTEGIEPRQGCIFRCPPKVKWVVTGSVKLKSSYRLL